MTSWGHDAVGGLRRLGRSRTVRGLRGLWLCGLRPIDGLCTGGRSCSAWDLLAMLGAAAVTVRSVFGGAVGLMVRGAVGLTVGGTVALVLRRRDGRAVRRTLGRAVRAAIG
ncbi:MAG: hypothetical protein M3N57_10750, partial [Actinomycetota bacterium]|nr:hypothetical protein [Actinomycetota bacterium]